MLAKILKNCDIVEIEDSARGGFGHESVIVQKLFDLCEGISIDGVEFENIDKFIESEIDIYGAGVVTVKFYLLDGSWSISYISYSLNEYGDDCIDAAVMKSRLISSEELEDVILDLFKNPYHRCNMRIKGESDMKPLAQILLEYFIKNEVITDVVSMLV